MKSSSFSPPPPSSDVASPLGAVIGLQRAVTTISPALAQQMTGVSWRPGCPVPLRDLRLVTATHHGFDGRDHTGRVIVHRDVAATLLRVLRRLYAEGFPIRGMTPVDAYGAVTSVRSRQTTPQRSTAASSTGRPATRSTPTAARSTSTRSRTPTSPLRHDVAHASRPYLRRTPFRPGMAAEGHALVRAFDAVGWGWGGRWSGAKDYQHFSASGR